jgi:predicted  nucleic acid-binding Zn-ribbon protein
MLQVIEKLLILQDRDHKILRVESELARIDPERRELSAKGSDTQQALESAKTRVNQLESDRKELELEVEAKKQLIAKYSVQQFQTKKNEEYRALTHEIETCNAAIIKLDDKQIELMEQIEAAQKVVAEAKKAATEAQKTIDSRLADLGGRETNLKTELQELQSNRDELAGGVEDIARSRYERLLKQKGQNVVVGIQNGVCAGCHMQLSRSIVVTCQAEQEIITCLNCGRILYYTEDMNPAVTE